MPFDLGDDAALVLLALCLVMEVLAEPLDHGQRRSPHKPCQPVRDPLAQGAGGGQPDGAEPDRLFKSRIDRGAALRRPDMTAQKQSARYAWAHSTEK